MSNANDLNPSDVPVRLTELALQLYFGPDPPEVDDLRRRMRELVRETWDALPEEGRRALEGVPRPVKGMPAATPAALITALRQALGTQALLRWARAAYVTLRTEPADAVLRTRIAEALRRAPRGAANLLDAAIRIHAARPQRTDEGLLRRSLAEADLARTTRERAMPTTPNTDAPANPKPDEAPPIFHFDPRGLPERFIRKTDTNDPAVVQQQYRDKVHSILRGLSLSDTDPLRDTIRAAVIGRMLRLEAFDPDAFVFHRGVVDAWSDLQAPVIDEHGTAITQSDGTDLTVKELMQDIRTELIRVRLPTPRIAYQELAAIGQYILEQDPRIVAGHPHFSTQVAIAVEKYVEDGAGQYSLELPPEVRGAAGDTTRAEPENIRAVAMVYAASNLEQAKVLWTVDRVVEMFSNGMLPVANDAGGKLLDSLLFPTRDRVRLTETERAAAYGRVLGMPGFVSVEVQPNTEFTTLLWRFVVALVEYNRSVLQTIVDRRGGQLALRAEYVRKAGRELAANCSLYGWGSTPFVARHLNAQINEAIGVLKHPKIMQAFGVSSPWQLIERVAGEQGQVPNIERYRTMADSGKRLLDFVAQYAHVWTKADGTPLFLDPTEDSGGVITAPGRAPVDIPREEEKRLMTQAQYFYAAAGMNDEQANRYLQPTEAVVAPSLPALGDGHAAGSNGALQQLQQMVATGQTPSLEQLQQILPSLRG